MQAGFKPDVIGPCLYSLPRGLTVDDVRAALEDAGGLMAATVAHHGALKCAIDIALHDLAGKRLRLPVRELLGIEGELPPTDFTLGLDEPAIVAERFSGSRPFSAYIRSVDAGVVASQQSP